MANYDNPNGFTPVSARPSARNYTASATVTRGDLLALVAGKVLPFAPATHSDAIGVALNDAVNGGTVTVCDDLDAEFRGQVATGTSYAAATHDGGRYDLTGTTGIMEVELGTQAQGVLQVLGHEPVPGSLDVGAHARVKFKIAQHALASLPAYDPGTVTFGEVSTDTISEKTGAAGVTVDGVLLKDSEVTTDTIKEKTSNAGVTVDGVLLKDSAVTTDTINEKTSGAGVTIDGTLIKDLRITIGAAAGSGETVTPKFGCVATTPANSAGWGKGSLIVDLSDGKVKTNTGTDASVTWTVVGTQS